MAGFMWARAALTAVPEVCVRLLGDPTATEAKASSKEGGGVAGGGVTGSGGGGGGATTDGAGTGMLGDSSFFGGSAERTGSTGGVLAGPRTYGSAFGVARSWTWGETLDGTVADGAGGEDGSGATYRGGGSESIAMRGSVSSLESVLGAGSCELAPCWRSPRNSPTPTTSATAPPGRKSLDVRAAGTPPGAVTSAGAVTTGAGAVVATMACVSAVSPPPASPPVTKRPEPVRTTGKLAALATLGS